MVKWKNGKLDINGSESLIISGAMHYFRTLPEQWQDRLEKLKALGFNTVETYCCWNLHEPREGEFRFDGMLDIERFIQIAQELELYVIIRPGPYICSEWDLGGLPPWLLKDDSIQLRSCQENYFGKVSSYMHRLMKYVVPHQITRGGNVILIAVENEYGSFASSRQYMQKCKELLRQCGVEVPLFTADGHTELTLNGGAVDGVLPGLDFGFGNGIHPEYIQPFQEKWPEAPIFHAEHWIGGISHWGATAPYYSAESTALEVEQQLQMGIHFNLYMFHGGTNFGFMNGANAFVQDPENRMKTTYLPDTTTYESDALLTECGDITPKYEAVQKVMSQYLKKPLSLPSHVETQSLGDIRLEKTASLFDNLEQIGTRYSDEFPKNMEHYDQNYGYILYRCRIAPGQAINLLGFERVYDRIHIYFNGRSYGIIERNDEKRYIEPDGWMDEGGVLELLVENQGRINFGPDMLLGDRKGICGYVYICDTVGVRQILSNWEIYTLPMTGLNNLCYGKPGRLPAFFRGTFAAREKKDCFIHLENFTKGFVVVNNFNLGRFWNIGPQHSLYLPWPILKEENEIIVFEEEKMTEPVVSIRDYHVLNERGDYVPAEAIV